MHFEQILRNLQNRVGTLYQKTGLNNISQNLSKINFTALVGKIHHKQNPGALFPKKSAIFPKKGAQ